MSRFREAMQALRGPLNFVREHPDRLERVVDAHQRLSDALTEAAGLLIPAAARRRLEEAGDWLGAQALDGELAEKIELRLGPLLDPGYPARALALGTDRVPGVGAKWAQCLSRREILQIEDLLFFLPRVYEDRRVQTPIDELQVGHRAVFLAEVVRAGVVPLRGGRRFLQAVVSDGSAAVQLKWFRGIAHFQDRLKPGQRVLVAGDVRRYRYAKELHHPDIEVLREDVPVESLARIVPGYAHVEGIPPRTLRRIVESAVMNAADLVEASLPPATAAELGLPSLGDALREVHLPSKHLEPEALRHRNTYYHLRLASEELFLLQAGLAMRRVEGERIPGRALPSLGAAVEKALASLPFSLTGDQERAWQEIAADLSRPRPMNRLLVGDVGTGKTVLAWLAAVAAHADGGVAAVLAPTEILAEQHERTFREFARLLGLRVALVTGQTPAAARRRTSRAAARGEIALVVGTHALLSKSLELPELRVAIIDEQHRFGVDQRRALVGKGKQPHLLAMSATPIPRTLSFTLFGDLDHSTLRERPPGRREVRTRVLPVSAARSVLSEMRATVARGEQVYVVYPLVEESEKQDLRDATKGYERLTRGLPEARVGLVHGRLDSADRVATMRRFAAGEIDLLVSTTVIEVGVDVANATLLVVQHAERFGLAQLHQLRGRVGRGNRPGQAVLLADPSSENAASRLAVLEKSASGFDVAEEDLRIRGAGQWLGTRQAGHLPELRIADLVRHAELLPVVRSAALDLLRDDPGLGRHPQLRAAVAQRWGRRLELAQVG